MLNEDVVTLARKILDEDAHNLRKQHHTVKRIFDSQAVECGFSGGETTVRHLVREFRENHQEAFVPLAFLVGDVMQIDCIETTISLNGIKIVVNLLCTQHCYNGAPMVLVYRRQNEESFLDVLV